MRLALFFTTDVSLANWDQNGNFDREVALYLEMVKRGIEVGFITYGKRADLAYARRLPGIRILCNQWNLPRRIYRRMIPILHGRWLSRCHVIKTNQFKGVDIALRSASLWRKPLIARAGYLWSLNMEREQGGVTPPVLRARDQEDKAFAHAVAVVVTTQQIANSITPRLQQSSTRLHVIPNFVETDRFRPLNLLKEYDLIFVGRIEPEKNLTALLEALRELPGVRLTVIGMGSLTSELQARFTDLHERVIWRGAVANRDLPQVLNQARIFILPSHYEGHPKALLEAMACGLPVIGTKVPGISDLIAHGKTGWLCETDPASIHAAISNLINNQELQLELGAAARLMMLEQFALNKVIEQELLLLRTAVGQ